MSSPSLRQSAAQQALLRLLTQRRHSSQNALKCTDKHHCKICQSQYLPIIEKAVNELGCLTMILPAFPAKSQNRDKTLSDLPDLGEQLALRNLNQLCADLEAILAIDVRLVICSDGRVFNDLLNISDQSVTDYMQEIEHIITHDTLNHLRCYSLNNCFKGVTSNQARESLTHQFAEPLAKVMDNVTLNDNQRDLFNGLHRFIFEDQINLQPLLSRNQIRQATKPIAYQVLQRSNAWSRCIQQHFPEALRLSIHPHGCGQKKLGIKLLPHESAWATPWHNVALQCQSNVILLKHKQARNINAALHEHQGRPSHYQTSHSIEDVLEALR